MRRVKDDFRVETALELIGFGLLKRDGALAHRLVHFAVNDAGIGGIDAERSDLSLESDGDRYFVKQIDAENAVDRASAGVADGTQIDSRQFQIAQALLAESQLR